MTNRRPSSSPPTKESLPTKQSRSHRRGGKQDTFRVQLEVVTPILGGAARAREIDEIDVIRVPTIRGHLRFWWRALSGHQWADADRLYQAEGALWGHAGDDEGGRSTVELTVAVDPKHKGELDDSQIQPYPRRDQPATPGAYALFPARGTNDDPVAPRRLPGTRFQLDLRCPTERSDEVIQAARAWILFGGYGGRTRRGLGSLTVVTPAEDWLPAEATPELLRDLLGDSRGQAAQMPSLRGAGLRVGPATQNAEEAWLAALNWLVEFRQGTSGKTPAREPGNQRPGRSNWPEADKVRQLSPSRGGWSHDPRHNTTPAWPRAGFGLPIIGQFQTSGPNHEKYQEPQGFELHWRDRDGDHDRLGSPLILKALPLADGRFRPAALWLHRAYPDGTVCLAEKDRRSERSSAPFDRLVAEGDEALFPPLADGSEAPEGQRLRTAFFGWLAEKSNVEVVAP